MLTNCLVCNKEFSVDPYLLKKQRRCCSRLCADIIRKKYDPDNNKFYCQNCKTEKSPDDFIIKNIRGTRFVKRPFCKPCRKIIAHNQPIYDKKREERSKEYRKKYHKQHVIDLRSSVINGYGSECCCCHETHWQFLQVDHINGDGHIERAKGIQGKTFYRYLIANNFPKDNYRLLCANCHYCMTVHGTCIHQETSHD